MIIQYIFFAQESKNDQMHNLIIFLRIYLHIEESFINFKIN